jgi:hypothetical protein
MPSKTKNIIFDNFKTINQLFHDDDTDFSYEQRLKFIENMCKYMHSSYKTQKMKGLYSLFKNTKQEKKSLYAQKILKEYMKYINEIFGKTHTEKETENKLFKKIHLNDIEETYNWLKCTLPDFEKIDLNSENALIYGEVQSGKTNNIFGVALMHLINKKPIIKNGIVM